jgi:hypothetical protein
LEGTSIQAICHVKGTKTIYPEKDQNQMIFYMHSEGSKSIVGKVAKFKKSD